MHLRVLAISYLRVIPAAAAAVPLSLLVLLTFASAEVDPASAGAPAVAAAPTDPLADELNRRLTTEVAPLLATYCLSCHTGDDAKADLPLERLRSMAEVLAGDPDIRHLREMVSTGEMPPKSKPQPTEHERLIITQWAEAALNYVPPDAATDPGWFTIHRLNRAEYRLTMRDLLGIDPRTVDLAERLPRDDTGYGFDNIADVLSISPLAVEQYLDSAERAIEMSLGPALEVSTKLVPLGPITGSGGKPLPAGGFFLYSNGAARAEFAAPLTGEYLIRVAAWESHAGDQHANLSLRLGKKTIKDFAVSGERASPQFVEQRVRLEAGKHIIAANFTNDYFVKDVGDRNLGVESISVAGPLDEASVERSAVWTRVFAPATGVKGDTPRARAVVAAFASRAYRRPATDAQIASLMKVYSSQRKAGAAWEPAVRTALTAALVSPHFLFRSLAGPTKAATPGSGSRYVLDGYELASRLSYFLYSSMPDEPLLAAAANGSLLTDQGLASQVRRMLADPRSNAFVENFAGQWLQLRTLDTLAIDRTAFPEYTDDLRAAMTTEATLFFADVLRTDRSVLDFLDSRDTFVNGKLASFYGLPEVRSTEFRRVKLPADSHRGGVLTMGAVLTLTSNTTRTSPVKRGLFVLDQMLGAPPPPPPADIPPLEQSVASNPDATVRERLAAHVANQTCASCHNRLDPLGLAFENFDAIGRWRTTENGRPVDASGTLPGGTSINGAAELKAILLSRADQFIEALSAKVLTYAVGRGPEPFDRPAIRRIATRTRAGNDRFSALIESVVLSDTFRTCRPRKSDRD